MPKRYTLQWTTCHFSGERIYRTLSPRQYWLHTDSDRWLFLAIDDTVCYRISSNLTAEEKKGGENDTGGHAQMR